MDTRVCGDGGLKIHNRASWYLVHGTWCMGQGAGCMVHGTWYLVLGGRSPGACPESVEGSYPRPGGRRFPSVRPATLRVLASLREKKEGRRLISGTPVEGTFSGPADGRRAASGPYGKSESAGLAAFDHPPAERSGPTPRSCASRSAAPSGRGTPHAGLRTPDPGPYIRFGCSHLRTSSTLIPFLSA